MQIGTAIARRGTIGVFQPSQARLDQLSAWFDSSYPSLLRFAYFVTGDRQTAEDLVQDTFIRLYRVSGTIETATLSAYARRTLVNLHRSGFRRKAREARAYAELGEARADADAPDVDARDEVWRAILTLSPRQRAIVALRYYEDLSERDTAEALGMSVGAVKKQTSRAMERLRELLGRQP